MRVAWSGRSPARHGVVTCSAAGPRPLAHVTLATGLDPPSTPELPSSMGTGRRRAYGPDVKKQKPREGVRVFLQKYWEGRV